MSSAEGRAQERHRRVALSAGASAFAKIISVGTALVSVPLSLHYLGSERYGIWIVMSSFISMLSFADLGLGNGVLTVIAASNGRDDRETIHAAVSSGFFALTIVAAAILGVFTAAYPFVAWEAIFNARSELAVQEAGPASAAFFGCFAVAIPFGVVQRVQMGLQQGFTASLWQALGSLLALGGVLSVIWFQGGLVWLVLAFAGAPLIAASLNTLTFFGVSRRDLAPAAAHVSWPILRRIARTGLLFLVLQMVVAVAYGSDSIIIAQVLGAQSVPQYAVPERMFSLITITLGMMLGPLWPAYGEAIERGDHDWVKRTLKSSLLISVRASALFSLLLVVFGARIISLWVGSAVEPPFLLLLGLGLWKTIEAAGNAVAMYLNGANVVRLQVIIAMLTGIAAVILKIVLIGRIGISGVVWATIIAFLAFSVLPLGFLLPRLIQPQQKLRTRSSDA